MFEAVKLQLSLLVQKLKHKRQFNKLKTFLEDEIQVINQLEPNPSQAKGTLVVKCDDLGDFIMWQHVIPHLTAVAERPITFVGNQLVKPLVETYFDFADHYIWIDKSQWEDDSYRLAMYKQVKQVKANLAFTSLFTRNFSMDDLLVYASSSENRIAWSRKHHPYFPQMDIVDSLLTEQIQSDTPIRLEYFRNIECINRLYNQSYPLTFKPLFPDFKKQKRLVIFPVANAKSKCWPVESFVQVVKEVASQFDQIILLGGKNAKVTCHRIETEADEPKLLNLCGQTGAQEIFAFIGESELLLCVDSFALHVGVATQTNTVLISNGTNWQRFTDYAPHVKSKFTSVYPPYFKPVYNKIKTAYSRSEITSIKVKSVVEAIRQMSN